MLLRAIGGRSNLVLGHPSKVARRTCPYKAGNNETVSTITRVASAQSSPDPSRQPSSQADSSPSQRPETDDVPAFLRGEMNEEAEAKNPNAGFLASAGVLGGFLMLGLAGYVFKDQIRHFLDFFIGAVDEWGVWGYAAYAAVYTGLEVLAVPAIPLTMTAGAIFGPVVGTGMVALSATTAATIAFLLARYALRDKVLRMAQGNKKFAAIDRAIGKDGLKFVTLLRLSPLLPLAASNYLYGLTSVDLPSYVLGSFIGMLPGTYAYVTAGHLGKAVLMHGEGSLGVESWQVALGAASTLLALAFVGRLAKKAIDSVDQQENSNGN